jgi:hypothetical protein
MIGDLVYYVEPQPIRGINDLGHGLELGLGEIEGEDHVAIVGDGVAVLLDREQTASLIHRLVECLAAFDGASV